MPVNFNKYTTKAAEAVQETLQLAQSLGHQAMTPLHLLHSLAIQHDGLIPTLLEKLGEKPDAVANRTKAALQKLPVVSGGQGAYMTPETEKILHEAESEA